MSRPSDYDDGSGVGGAARVESPEIGLKGLLRWFWRQLTSMRVALILLLLLAVAAIPGSATPQQRSEILAAHSLGLALIRLRRACLPVGSTSRLDAVLSPLARGDITGARDRLGKIERALRDSPSAEQHASTTRIRGLLQLIDDGLAQHAAYFSGGSLE